MIDKTAEKTGVEPVSVSLLKTLFLNNISSVVACAATALWISFCIAYSGTAIGFHRLITLPPHEIGLFLLGTISIPALVWMGIGYRNRVRSLDVANRVLSRYISNLSKGLEPVFKQNAADMDAARRESLSLFEAAQATLASLREVQAAMRKDTADLQSAATESVQQLTRAGQAVGKHTASVTALTGQFGTVSTEFDARTASALNALKAALERVEEVGSGLNARVAEVNGAGEAVTQRAERNADSMRIALAALSETAALLEGRGEALRKTGQTVTGEMKIVNERLGESAGILDSRIAGLAEAGGKLLVQSGDMARMSQDHAAAINIAADGLTRKTEAVQDRFAASLSQIGAISDEVGQRMDEASSRIGNGLDGMRNGVSEVSASFERFTDAGESLARHRQELDEMMAATLQRMADLASRFDGQMSTAGATERAVSESGRKLLEALTRIRAEQEATARDMDAFGDRTQGISMRLEGLRTAAISGVGDLITEADRLQRRSELLTDELKGQSGVLGDAITRAGDIADMLRATGALVNDAVAKIGQASQQARTDLHDVGHEIEAQGGRLEKRAEHASQTLVGAQARLEQTVSHIDGVLGGLDRRAGEINFTVSSSLSRLGELSHGLERARAVAVGSSDNVSANIDSTAATLRASIERMRETADEIAGASTLAADASDRLVATGGTLRDRVREITSSAGEANETIRRSAEDLSVSAGRTRAELEAIARQVQQENDAIAGMIGRIADVDGALRTAGAVVEEIVARAAKSAEAVRAELHAVGREIGVQSKLLSDTSAGNGDVLGKAREQMEGVVGQVQDAFTDLNRKATEINFVVSTAVNRLGELSRGMDDAKTAVDATSDGVARRMAGVAAGMRDEFGSVNDIASRALERLERTLSSIAATSANAEAETQRAEQRMTSTFELVRQSGEGFAEAVDTAVTQFARAEQALAAGQGRLIANAEESNSHLLKLARDLASGGFDLGNTATATVDRIANASALVETRLQAINAISDQMRGALALFATELAEVSTQSGQITQALSDRGHVLRDNIVQIVRTADDAGTSLRTSATSLLASVTDISDAASRGRTEIVRATTQLREEGSAVLETEAESRALMVQVSALLGEKALEMVTAARAVASETVTMREVNARMQRDLFLAAAKTVLEGLRSLSVDLSRVLDRELPEELRRELARGDLQTFVQRLAAMRDQVPAAQLRAKFSADGLFRSHVQAYLAKFEELLAQAMQVDQGEVLSSTLMSSDVGKIYYFLTAAIGTDRDSVRQTG